MNADDLRVSLDFRSDSIRTEVHSLFWEICASNGPLDLDDIHEKLESILTDTAEMVRSTNDYLDCHKEARQ